MSRMRATGLLALALLFAGTVFDSPSLYVPGIGLLLLAAAALAWVRLARRGASVERLAGAWSVVEGEPYRLATRVRRGRPVGGSARLVDRLLERPVAVESRGELVVESLTSFPRRGRAELPEVVLELADPFELRRARIRSAKPSAVLVLPRVEPVTAPPLGAALAEGGGDGAGPGEESGLDAAGVDFELDGLRPYRPGTPASRIHWRSVARSDELIEHRMVSGGGSDPLVVLDAHLPEGVGELDCAVRAAASLCVHLATRGGCHLLLPDDPRPARLDRGLRAWPQLHARLALVEKSRQMPQIGRGGSAVFWVSAAADAARAAFRAGAGGYLVTPGEPRQSDAFAVAGCRGRLLAVERASDADGGRIGELAA
jgi:uncharacterized protein (DUF58 family)